MTKENPQAAIVSEEQLVQMPQPDAKKLYTKPPTEKQILVFIKKLGYDEDPKDEFEWQAVDRTLRPTKMSKLIYTRFTKLIFDYFLSCNKSIPRKSDSDMHNKGQDSPLTKLMNIVEGKFKFGMEIPYTKINDAIKQLAGYKYYKHKKNESEKAKCVEEPNEQHVSPVRSGSGKGYMRLGNQEVNIPSAFKKNVVPRKPRSITIADNLVSQEERQIEKYVEDMYVEWGQKLKGPAIEDPAVQSLLELHKESKQSRLESLRQEMQVVREQGSSAAHDKYYKFEDISATDSEVTRDTLGSYTDEEKDDDSDDSDDKDLSDDEPKGDDDATGFGVFVYNKSKEPLKSTYLSPTVTCSYLEYIQSLMNEPPTYELEDFMNNLVYIDAHTTSVEMFPDEAVHHISSPPANTTYNPITNPQQNSLQAKAKKLMEKAKKNMRKVTFRKANKSNETNETHQNLYNTLYKFISLDHEAMNALDAKPSFHKRTHDDQDHPNDREGEKRKKRRKDAGEPSSRSSRKEKSPVMEQKDSPLSNRSPEWNSSLGRWKTRLLQGDHKKEYEFSYADLPRLSLNDIEDMYLLKVQDKLHHLQSDFEKDFNNALLLFIRRTIIQNRAEDLLKGRDWNEKDIRRSNEMIAKIDQTLKYREQLRRFKEYVRGRLEDF
ncbi:hypothetical protein Tco_0231164 [Tanacetum coccineum]